MRGDGVYWKQPQQLEVAVQTNCRTDEIAVYTQVENAWFWCSIWLFRSVGAVLSSSR